MQQGIASFFRLSPIALTLILTACGGGGSSSADAVSGAANNAVDTSDATGGGSANSGHRVEPDTYVAIASWAYNRIITAQLWALSAQTEVTVMQYSLDGFGGRPPYNMSSNSGDCGSGGHEETEFKITAPTLDAGDAVVYSAINCSNFTIVGNRTENSVRQHMILSGSSMLSGYEMQSTQTATATLANGTQETQSMNFSYRISEDADEDMHFEVIDTPGLIHDSRSDTTTFHAFKYDENDRIETTVADLDIEIGSTDSGNFSFAGFRVSTVGVLQEYAYPHSSIFGPDDQDESGDDGSKDRLQSGSIKVQIDGGQILSIESSGDGLEVRVSLDSDGDGSDETNETMLFNDFRREWVRLFL